MGGEQVIWNIWAGKNITMQYKTTSVVDHPTHSIYYNSFHSGNVLGYRSHELVTLGVL